MGLQTSQHLSTPVSTLESFDKCSGKMHTYAVHLQDTIFAEAYGGERRPYSPVRFLDTWWRNAEGSLAGYQQQDAHEFYLSLLDGLGQASDKYTPSASGSPSPAPTSHTDPGMGPDMMPLAKFLIHPFVGYFIYIYFSALLSQQQQIGHVPACHICNSSLAILCVLVLIIPPISTQVQLLTLHMFTLLHLGQWQPPLCRMF